MRQITVYRTFTKLCMTDNVDDCHMSGRLRFSGTRKHGNMFLFSENFFPKRRVCQAKKTVRRLAHVLHAEGDHIGWHVVRSVSTNVL